MISKLIYTRCGALLLTFNVIFIEQFISKERNADKDLQEALFDRERYGIYSRGM